jgi:hypothetical protein
MDDVTIKPKLSLKAIRLFYAIAAYAHTYQSSTILDNAASDVMDGRCCRSNRTVKELIGKGILRPVRGSWELTDYGRKVLCFGYSDR